MGVDQKSFDMEEGILEVGMGKRSIIFIFIVFWLNKH